MSCRLERLPKTHAGNASSASAQNATAANNQMAQKELGGHCYTGLTYHFNPSPEGMEPIKSVSTLLEGTKWVSPLLAKKISTAIPSPLAKKINRNAYLDCPTVSSVNQMGSLVREVVKHADIMPTSEVGYSRLVILQGDATVHI